MAETRDAEAFAIHCKAKGRTADIPSNLFDAREIPYINLDEDPFPPSEEEQEDPSSTTTTARAMATAAAGAASATEGAAKTIIKKAPPTAPPVNPATQPKKSRGRGEI